MTPVGKGERVYASQELVALTVSESQIKRLFENHGF